MIAQFPQIHPTKGTIRMIVVIVVIFGGLISKWTDVQVKTSSI